MLTQGLLATLCVGVSGFLLSTAGSARAELTREEAPAVVAPSSQGHFGDEPSSPAPVAAESTPDFVRQMPFELAQVNNADLACYLHTLDGQQFDLSALCAGYEEPAQEVVLQTGDVQVTLRWDTADDLDLYVRDPDGEEVSFFNPAVPSGGQLDVDANAGCMERMAAPVENIFWPTGGGALGDYVATVNLFSYCGDEVPINFTLNILANGQVQTQSGTVSNGQASVSFPFSFSNAPAPSEDALDGNALGLPPLPAPSQG